MQICSELLVVISCIATVSLVEGKAGVCPSPSGSGICTSTCNSDEACAGYLKCCPNSCGALTCAYPDALDYNNYPQDKPGRCPPIDRLKGFCTTNCASDQQCRGSLKCCTNNCGASTCVFPES